jgi:hypothetical protein
MNGHHFDGLTGHCSHCGIPATAALCPPLDMALRPIWDPRALACPGPDSNVRQISVTLAQRRVHGVVAAYRPC